MHPGDVIDDRFEVEHLAGRGGMGSVYRARDRLTGEPVALKVLEVPDAPEAAQRFGREARVLADLRHRGIVRYVAQGATAEGSRYLAMAWLQGEDLSARLSRGALTIAETMLLAERAAEALTAAHAAGVVHRDIKPSNIFLADGSIDALTLIDFGIAREPDGAAPLTLAGAVLGTPGYIAPEQARGEQSIDPRADVFSLGCVLFRCLTGSAPFAGASLGVLLGVTLDAEPRPSALRSDVPRALDDLICWMLSADPARRPRSGAEVLAALTAVNNSDHASDSAHAPAAALGSAERRVACLVLARAEGSPAAGASAAGTLLGTARHAVEHAVAQHRGELHLLDDGALVAAFGGAGAATDLARNAARCALELRGLLPSSRLAVVTGRLAQRDRLPVGEMLDRGVALLRLEIPPSASASAGVRLDGPTGALLDERFEVSSDDHGTVLHAERDRLEASRTVLGRRTPLVGRDSELLTLTAVYEECVSEPRSRVVLVSGEAGIGKSRLIRDFLGRVVGRRAGSTESVVDSPPRLWVARGDPLATSPFSALAPLLRRLAGIRDGEPLPERRGKIAALVARSAVDDAARVTQFLAEIAGVPFPENDAPELGAARREPPLYADQTRRALEDFTAAECAKGPLVLVLEDLHWADARSVQLVDAVLRRVRYGPLLVLALARPEVHRRFPKLWEARALTELRLGPLSARAAARLVSEVLVDVAQDRAAEIVEIADGNPFYIEELLRAEVEPPPRSEGSLPRTVVAMVMARLSRLDGEQRRALRAASVFGARFWAGAVGALLGAAEPAPGLRALLRELESRELCQRVGSARFPGEVEYAFRHALVRQAAYSSLTDEDLRLGHRLAGEWLEGAGETDASVLAEHFDRGREPTRALSWWRRAAEHALAANDCGLAVERAHRAVRCGAAGEELGSLLLLQAEAHHWRGEYAEDEARAREAIELLPRESEAWWRAVGELAIALGRQGKTADLARIAADLAALRWDPAAPQAQAIAGVRVGVLLLVVGDPTGAADLLARVERTRPRGGAFDPATEGRLAEARAMMALRAGDLGAYMERVTHAARALEQAGELRNALNQRVSLAYGYIELGAFEAAENELRAVLAQTVPSGLRFLSACAKSNLGRALTHRARATGQPERAQLLAEARALEQEAAADFAAHPDLRMEGGSRTYLAEVLALEGDLPAAIEQARVAAELLAGAPPLLAEALATRARALLAAGRSAEALEQSARAMRLLDELGEVEAGEALVRLVHAEALQAAGEGAAAGAVIGAARERLLERAAAIHEGWRAQFLAVPDHARTLKLAAAWREGR